MIDSDNKRGHLEGDFEFFHIKEKRNLEFEFHYHEFNKIIIFISGGVTYVIEGKIYNLKPWDILMVGSHEIHKPLIQPEQVYDRIVIWVNSEFILRHNSDDSDLLTCFRAAAKKNHNLLRLSPDNIQSLRNILTQLEDTCNSSEFGSRILKNALFIQALVNLNRNFLDQDIKSPSKDIVIDEQIDSVINYINENLSSELSIEFLALKFFTSKYYLMHKFKNYSGYSIHSYIVQKRLILASKLLKEGVPATNVSIECGFGDYSSFVRAFKKTFGYSPREHTKKTIALLPYEHQTHF